MIIATGLRRRRLVLALLCVAPPSALAQKLTITPYDSSGIYAQGGTVGWTLALAPGDSAIAGAYTYTIRENGGPTIRSGSFELAKGPAKIEAAAARPAMILVEIKPPAASRPFGDRSTGGPGRILLGAAVEPTSIRPVVSRPADFDEFWAAQLAQLGAVPMAAVVTPKETTVPGVEYATVRLNNVGGAHVYGQLAKPKRDGRFPALLVMQWASPPYPLPPAWVTDRAAEGWLAMNVEPHDVPSDMPQAFYDALPQMIKSYQSLNDSDRDRNYFRQMYLGDYRALEYLRSRPDWDGRTLVVMGTSMGGQQSLAVAGLEPRVTGVIVHVPAGADALAGLHERMAGYPNWNVKKAAVAATAPYFDVVNFASRIKAPALVSMGFIDEVCPAVGIWTAFNLIPGGKEPVPMPDAHHNHLATPQQQAAYTKRSAEWLVALVRGEPAPVRGGAR